MRPELQSQFDHYVGALYAPEDAGLLKIRKRIEGIGRTGINISAVEGRILQVLMKMVGVKTAVEVGTLCGYSSVWIARALPEDGALITIEKDPRYAALAAEGIAECGVAERVSIRQGDASEVLKTLTGTYDFVFIDANKTGYNLCLDWAMNHVRSGGLIVADNTLLFGSVMMDEKPDDISIKPWNEMRRFNERLADQSNFTSVMLPTSEGLSLALKK